MSEVKMVNKKVREHLAEMSPDSIVFDNPSFDNSIIGISIDGNIIYDLEKMVEEMSLEDGITEEEALEFIEYNTFRALPYCNEGIKPVIMDYDCGIKDALCEVKTDE